MASQELIFAAIPWATAGADRSRAERVSDPLTQHDGERESFEPTPEELLLSDLLGANADLVEALRLYEDLERVALERETEDRSRKDTRMDRRVCSLSFLYHCSC